MAIKVTDERRMEANVVEFRQLKIGEAYRWMDDTAIVRIKVGHIDSIYFSSKGVWFDAVEYENNKVIPVDVELIVKN